MGDNKPKPVFSCPSAIVTVGPQRVTMKVIQESADYYILESNDGSQICKPKDVCKVESVSFVVNISEIL